MSFRLKTILGVAAIEAILLTLLVWSGLEYISQSNQREFTQRAIATVKSFAVTSKDAVLSTDLASLESFVTEVLSYPGVVYARVRDADGRVLAPRGTKVYGRVVVAKAGTGAGGKPELTLELTDIELGGRVLPLSTAPVSFSGEAKKAGRKVLGGAALGAGIGGMIDGGEGAAWGAGIGAVAGVAAAKSSPGNQVAVSPGTALEFRLAQPLSVAIVS